MRIAEDDDAKGHAAIRAALDAGYVQFDHADIYCGGECESLFGRFLRNNPGVRDDIVVISKCGIRFAGDPDPDSPKRYDFSGSHILKSVEGSLARLGVDHLDVLLLHRPDYFDDDATVLERTPLERLAEDKQLGAFRHEGFWQPMDTLREKQLLEDLWRSGDAPWKVWA